MDVTGIILAGGKSSRMGREKGMVPFHGKPMIAHIIDVLEKMNVPIIISSGNVIYEKFGYPVVSDKYQDKGPLSGIYSGITHSNTAKHIVISCDSPLVSVELIEWLLSNSINYAITIPNFENRSYPLIGIYSREILPVIKSRIESNNLSLTNLLSAVNTNILDVPSDHSFGKNCFSNINTLEELKNLEE